MPQKTTRKAAHLATGAEGEELAAAFLQAGNMRIVERNWRTGRLELDIIARDGSTLVFVEVKSRTESAPAACNSGQNPPFGRARAAFHPLDAFNRAKQAHVLQAASSYLEQKSAWKTPCRFDLICIIFKPDGNVNLEHHKNVLSLECKRRGAVGSGHTPWQPW